MVLDTIAESAQAPTEGPYVTLSAAQPDAPEIPELPTGVINVQPPPDKVEPQGVGNIIAMALPMIGSMGVMVFMAMQAGSNPRMMIMGGAMVFAMLAMVGFNIYRQISTYRNQVMTTRREYLAYLAELRNTARTAASQQRRFTSWHMPDPRALVLVAEERSRLWERDASEGEALTMRLGSSTQDLSMVLEEPELPPLANPDPVCFSAVHRFVATHREVDDMPFGIALGSFSHVDVGAEPEQGRAQVRAMVAHLAMFIPPTALRIAVLCSDAARPSWEWMKWLPHARSSEVSDALGPARMIVTEAADLADLLGPDVTTRPAFEARGPMSPWPHVVIVVDDATLPPTTRLGSREGTSGVTVINLRQTWGALTSFSTLRMLLHPAAPGERRGRMEVLLLDNEPIVAVPDQMSIDQAEAVARRLAPWSEEELPDTGDAVAGRSDPKRSADLMDLLGLGDVRDFNPDVQWRRREGRDRLRVPFAVTPEGVPVVLDIKESAQHGMGPHGLLIGATGSGKSEVLRTLVLALTLTHSPEQLNLVLVDFKGGATFAGMSDLPHVSAMISNLESELSLVDRMQDAIRGEMVRRQELLREAGNYANVTDYEAARLAGKHHHPPLPALFLVLDEFSELLSAKPEFIDLFVAVGRLGRSMGIHLLLASQRLEEGRLRGLESHLSYRIGLRTFSAAESRAVLGVTDAFELPSIPGVGLLSSGTGSLTQFRASYVAAPPAARKADARMRRQAGARNVPIKMLPFTVDPQLDLESESEQPAPSAPDVMALPGDEQYIDMTQLDIAVARMRGHGMPAHQVWLPPLEVPDTLDMLFADLAVDPQLGLISRSWREKGWLRVPLGIVDVPLEQRRETLEFDLSGAGGHLAVVGGPLSGKSTTLRSLVMALSLTHTPREVQFFVLDFGGGSFAPFDGAAHIAGVGTRDQSDVVRRTIAQVEGILQDRERYFRANRIDSMSTYRSQRAKGLADDGYGDVFLVIDGWSTIRSDFEDLEQRIMVMMGRALTYGVHLVLAASRWLDMRQQVRDIIGSKLELRLGDPSDSDIDRKVAVLVPDKRPGRGLEVGGHHVMVALPRADGDQSVETLADGVRGTLADIAEAWGGEPGPKLRLLPELLELEEARALAPDDRRLVLGTEESRLGPLFLDPKNESFWYLLGDSKSGKSNFLRTVAHEIMRTHGPKEAQLFIVDVRRSLLGEVPEQYLTHYLTNRDDATGLFKELAQYLRGRLPGEDITPEQLRTRSWWKGADIWILVDDYDLVATASGNPLAALQPLMGQAADIGLHIVVARRSGGAMRAMYEAVLQSMVELGATGVLLSGSPDEGQIIGRVKMQKAVPGRAQVVSRDHGLMAAQIAWTPPSH